MLDLQDRAGFLAADTRNGVKDEQSLCSLRKVPRIWTEEIYAAYLDSTIQQRTPKNPVLFMRKLLLWLVRLLRNCGCM